MKAASITSVATLLIGAVIIPVIFGYSVVSQAHGVDLSPGSVTERAQMLRIDLSSDPTPVAFSIGQVHYRVPRNYMSQMTDYHGGPQDMVTFEVTYPGFQPLTEETKKCFESRAEALESGLGCKLLNFWINIGGEHDLSDDDHFQNERSLFHSQIPKPAPNGFEFYEIGPPEALIRTYRKKLSDHTLLIQCFQLSNPRGMGICTNYASPLPSGNGLSYRIDEGRLSEAEVVDNGIRSLIRSFIVEGKRR